MTELLIDGTLVAGGSGTFATINPATEEPIGTAADADTADMDRAIAAARTAFDDTDWSRDVALRVHCLRQLRDAPAVGARRDWTSATTSSRRSSGG